MTMTRLGRLAILPVLLSAISLSFLATSTVTQAATDYDETATTASEDEVSYDAIVDQLSKENSAQAASSRAKQSRVYGADPFDSILMHGGVGYANFVQTVRTASGRSYTMNQPGIQAALGIDLFSTNWMAEGTARSFNEAGNSNVRSSVQEFELKLIYKDRFTPLFGYRAGIGLAGRYLTIKEAGLPQADYTTPTSVATVGGDFFINEKFSLGADMNVRNSMIGETIDRNSFDATLRVDTHF